MADSLWATRADLAVTVGVGGALIIEEGVGVGCGGCGNLASCVCAIKRLHAEGCRYRRAACLSVEVACEHGCQACPVCDPCTCGAEAAVRPIF